MRNYSFEDDQYRVEFTEEAGKYVFRLEFKKPAPPPVQPERPRGAGQRVVVRANEHMRRQGMAGGDDMIVLDHGDGCYEVSSRSEPGAFHIVMVEGKQETCDCVASHFGRLCRHVKGVRTLLGRDVDAPLYSKTGPVPQAPAYDLPLELTVEPSD